MKGNAVRAIQLTKTYASPAGPVEVLAGVDLLLGYGETVALEGTSGSGKSTLLHMLGLLDLPTSGSLSIAGRDSSELTIRERDSLRARHIGFVFQQCHLIPYKTTVKNVAMSLEAAGAPRIDRDVRAREALSAVGLAHRLKARPTTLSGGEQQRVAIARALARKPSILLCDEPTGNLDVANTDILLDVLLRAANEDDVAVLIVTHDAAVAARANRRVRLVNGAIEEMG